MIYSTLFYLPANNRNVDAGMEDKINNFKMEGCERQEKGKCRNRDGSIQERKKDEMREQGGWGRRYEKKRPKDDEKGDE